jgi:hypothetical protein
MAGKSVLGKAYWLLMVRWETGGEWSVEFGDSERSVVVDEAEIIWTHMGRNGSYEPALRANDIRIARGRELN